MEDLAKWTEKAGWILNQSTSDAGSRSGPGGHESKTLRPLKHSGSTEPAAPRLPALEIICAYASRAVTLRGTCFAGMAKGFP